MKIFLSSALLILLLPSLTSANDLTDPAYGLWGIGVVNRNLNYKETESETSIAPFIFGGYGAVSIEANRAAINVYKNGTFFASVVGQLRTHQFRDANDNPAFASLGDRDQAIELGAQIGARLPAGFFTRLALLQDVSGAHESHEWDLQLYRRDTLGKIRLLTSVGIQYQDKRLVNYYYGTPTYQPGNAFAAELELIATYPVGNWGIFAGTRSYIFDSEVNNSPLVDNNKIIQLFAGVGYYF
ncbi:MAG: MipA/OmpV family protein [Gammaproteobacteria bacterium]|nr:MipA/OmpV family protein [Gammaproteobacteria bacterium]